jgi:hypothetical protein
MFLTTPCPTCRRLRVPTWPSHAHHLAIAVLPPHHHFVFNNQETDVGIEKWNKSNPSIIKTLTHITQSRITTYVDENSVYI